MAGLTAPIVPLPQDSQRFTLAPKGERASMALTCASEHSCGSLLVPPMIYQPSAFTGGDEQDRRRAGTAFFLMIQSALIRNVEF